MNISRFHNFKNTEFPLKFLSPCFLGGADQNAEFRSAPIKYALRQWWRILYGPEYANIKNEEDSRFGSTDVASRIRFYVEGDISSVKIDTGFSKGAKILVKSKGSSFPINILDYLAYGHYEYKDGQNHYLHSWLPSGKSFKLLCSYPAAFEAELRSILCGMTSFGCVGSRSRNGFGSLHLLNQIPQSLELPDFSSRNPVEYPTLNKLSKLFVTKNGYDSWEEALSQAGIAYKKARSALESRHSFDRRGLIARPIEVKKETISPSIKNGRCPKQFFLRVVMKDEKFFGQILSLPIIFYEIKEQKKYEDVIKDMHNSLNNNSVFTDKTPQIKKYLEGKW